MNAGREEHRQVRGPETRPRRVPLPEEAAGVPSRRRIAAATPRPASSNWRSVLRPETASRHANLGIITEPAISSRRTGVWRFAGTAEALRLATRKAQNNLGTMFLNGSAAQRDPAQAIHWYRKSAEQGLAIAQYNLAKRYYGGDGIDQDYAEARKWFEKASVQGEAWASCELGTMHRFGQGVPRNLLAAAEFHLIAAEAGDDVAILGNIAEYHAELEEMALSGSQLASLFFSRIYNRGFGVDKSQPMTWAWISCAKKYGSRDVYPDTAEEVDEAYHFYHMSITSENRKEGQKRLKDMRAAHNRRLRKQP